MNRKQVFAAAMLAVCLLTAGCGGDEGRQEAETTPSVQTAVPAEMPTQAQEKKSAFLARAAEIQNYEVQHLQTAMTQMEINQESGIVYEKWDTLLNDVWAYLQDTLPETAYAALLEEQLAWIDEKEAAMAAASAGWQGGSGEPMARFGEGISYTRDRCFVLIEEI